MDFLFSKEEEYDENSLYQGDLLVKNERLQAAIKESHGYYADAADYTHFLVLTQSCDLVRRDGKPKSPYIVLAAVRPLKKVVDRFLDRYEYPGFDLPVKIRPSMVVTRVLQLLTNKSYVSPKPEVQAAAANILINDPALKSIISAAESE